MARLCRSPCRKPYRRHSGQVSEPEANNAGLVHAGLSCSNATRELRNDRSHHHRSHDGPLPGHHDRPRARRRQRHRHRAGRRRAAEGTARQGDPRRHHRRHRAAHRLCRRHDPTAADRRPAARRRTAAALGLLEDVARAARRRHAEECRDASARHQRGRHQRREAPQKTLRAGRPGRSSSPTFRCRSTTSWRSRARRASIPMC